MVSRKYLQSGASKSRGRRGRTAGIRRPLALFLLLTAALFAALHFLLDETVRQVMVYQGRILASETLARETLSVLQELDVSYGDLAEISRDSQGRVVSVQVDSAAVNRIKNLLARRVTQALPERSGYSLPLGTLLGNGWLSGRGPEVPLWITPVGYLESGVESEFLSAGINQTNHRLVLRLTLSYTTVVPLHRADFTVETDFILAETVIVGQVPEYNIEVKT